VVRQAEGVWATTIRRLASKIERKLERIILPQRRGRRRGGDIANGIERRKPGGMTSARRQAT